MTLVRFRPYKDFDMGTVPKRFSDMIDDFFNDALDVREREAFKPGVDISEDNTHYHVRVSLPGIKKEDVKINLDDNVLHISGERRQEKKQDEVKYHLLETSYGKFERAFTLPENVDSESIKAEFKDGLLHLAIEKKEKKVSKQISIK